MPDSNRQITPSGGVLHELALRIKLIVRLMGDSRVNFFLKLIPIASVAYFFNPFDIPGPLDDLGILGLGMYTFVELCPSDVVEEHLSRLRNINFEEKNIQPNDPDVVDGEFHEEK